MADATETAAGWADAVKRALGDLLMLEPAQRLEALASQVPPGDPAVFGVFGLLAAVLDQFDASAAVDPVGAAAQRATARTQSARAGEAVGALVGALVQATHRLLDAGVNDPGDAFVRVKDCRRHGVLESGLFAGSACGWVESLPADHPARSVPPVTDGNGDALLVLGHPRAPFVRLSAVARMTGALAEHDRRTREEREQNERHAEALRLARWRETPAGRDAALAELVREVERLKAGTVGVAHPVS